MESNFKFNLNDEVVLLKSDETGTVIGRSESLDFGRQYLVRYKSGDGRQVEAWWTESAISRRA